MKPQDSEELIDLRAVARRANAAVREMEIMEHRPFVDPKVGSLYAFSCPRVPGFVNLGMTTAVGGAPARVYGHTAAHQLLAGAPLVLEYEVIVSDAIAAEAWLLRRTKECGWPAEVYESGIEAETFADLPQSVYMTLMDEAAARWPT